MRWFLIFLDTQSCMAVQPYATSLSPTCQRSHVIYMKEIGNCKAVLLLISLFWVPFSFIDSELCLLTAATVSSLSSSLTAGRASVYVLGSGTKLRQVRSCYLQVVSCTDKPISRSVVAGNSLPKMVRPNLEILALGIVKLCTLLDMWVKTELEGAFQVQAYWWWSKVTPLKTWS